MIMIISRLKNELKKKTTLPFGEDPFINRVHPLFSL